MTSYSYFFFPFLSFFFFFFESDQINAVTRRLVVLIFISRFKHNHGFYCSVNVAPSYLHVINSLLRGYK